MDRLDADLIRADEHGYEKWYVTLEFGGTDEGGTYQIVLDGPAKGEKVYVGE